MDSSHITPGLEDPVHDAQNIFRELVSAMSRPGQVRTLNKTIGVQSQLSLAMTAVSLTLLDYETPYWLSETYRNNGIGTYITFHTGAACIEDTKQAKFLLVDHVSALPELALLSHGTLEYPDTSATVVLEVEDFSSGQEVQLSGPGIEEKQAFSALGLDTNFWQMAQKNQSNYPLGIDFIFCSKNKIAALPRSTKIEV